jgi:putative phosphoesterase
LKRVAALYDVHGMLDALDAVLADVEREDVDLVVLGGDVVGGPQPAETLARLRGVGDGVRWVRGNADRALLEGPGAIDAGQEHVLAWTAARLTEADRQFLGTLPEREVLDVDGLGRVLFCHATPASDLPIVTAGTPDERLREIVAGVDADVVVAGHTHIQFDRVVDGVRWVNAGSVGMPYEGEAAAFWALLGPDVSFRRTPFDVEAAAEAILASGWPAAEEFVTENLRDAVPRDETIALFERIAAERGER